MEVGSALELTGACNIDGSFILSQVNQTKDSTLGIAKHNESLEVFIDSNFHIW